MILFAVYTAAETLNAFQWARPPPKLPLLVGDLDFIKHVVPKAHMSQPPNCISVGSAVFAHYTSVSVTNATHRQTHRPRYMGHIAMHHFYAMYTMWPDNNTFSPSIHLEYRTCFRFVVFKTQYYRTSCNMLVVVCEGGVED